MIWRRTIVLFFAALAVTAILGVKIHREARPRCTAYVSSGEIRFSTVAQENTEAGFTPCFIDSGVTTWVKILVWSWFILTVAFCSSLAQDCFIYIRGRHAGRIVGPFRLLR